MAQHTHDCDELALVLRMLVAAIDGDAGSRKSNQYRTGDLVNLPLFQAAKKALDGAHASFRYREQLEAAAKAAAYVVLDTPRAPLPEISRERLRDLDAALEVAEPDWRNSSFFWHHTHPVTAETALPPSETWALDERERSAEWVADHGNESLDDVEW